MPVVKECRFCMGEELKEGDAWLSPCACAGTIKWVHRSCFNQWLAQGTTNDDQRTRCPVCRHEYRRRCMWWKGLLCPFVALVSAVALLVWMHHRQQQRQQQQRR